MPKRNVKREAPFPIPAVLRIRGKRWLVLREHHLGGSDYDHAVRRDLRRLRGETDYNAREIHLGRNQSPRGEAYTLIHEILHACSRGRVSVKAEETFIADVERALMDVLEQLFWRRTTPPAPTHLEKRVA